MTTAARRDRLLNLLCRTSSTVPALAATLGVSDRTVYRDILALRNEGHAIDAAPGRGGGVRLRQDSRPRAVHFEVAEVIGLALSVAVLKALPGVPFAHSAEAALDRARHALSAPRQRALERLERRILIGRPASPTTTSSVGPLDLMLLRVFERCFTEGRRMAFRYVSGAGIASDRCIECIALVLHAPVWYVIGWDVDKQEPRVFRMDRITEPTCGDALLESPARSLDDLLARSDDAGSYGDWVGSRIV